MERCDEDSLQEADADQGDSDATGGDRRHHAHRRAPEFQQHIVRSRTAAPVSGGRLEALRGHAIVPSEKQGDRMKIYTKPTLTKAQATLQAVTAATNGGITGPTGPVGSG